MNVRVLIRPKSGDEAQEVLVPGQESFVLGRGPTSAAPLDGPGISREHLAISLDGSNILVTDLSVNGAWVNGKRLPSKEKYRMKPGEIVELPGYELKFQPVNPTAAPPAPAANGQTQTQTFAPLAEIEPAAPKKGVISEFIGSFSFMERVLILAAVSTIILAVVYITSY